MNETTIFVRGAGLTVYRDSAGYYASNGSWGTEKFPFATLAILAGFRLDPPWSAETGRELNRWYAERTWHGD